MGVEIEDGQRRHHHHHGTTNHSSLVFTYGTLKKGFPNHGLIQELIRTGDAISMGVYCTSDKYPLVCGPYRVPFLINLPGQGERVWGEVYAVSGQGLGRMDELEGTDRGHYERLPIVVVREEKDEEEKVSVEAYYAHRSYGEELWKRTAENAISSYTPKEATGYVKRIDRPPNTTFLDQIRLFLSSSRPPPPPPPLD